MLRDCDVRGILNRRRRLTRLASTTTLLLLCALTFAAACSGNTRKDQAAEPIPPTYLSVDNRAYLDMTIYVYKSSQRIRLGTATGNNTTKMLIPANLIFGITPLRFQASPIGGRRQPTSEEINVEPGDEVQLHIPPA